MLYKNITNQNKPQIFYTFFQSYFFVLFCLMSSCKESVDIKDIEIRGIPELKIDLPKGDINSLKVFENIFESPRVISLKSKDTSFLIAAINKVVAYRNELYILDGRFSSLARFDSLGNFITKYGKIGLGDNEFSKITDFDIDSLSNRLVIFSNENRALYYYSLKTATFIKKINIQLYGNQISILPNNNIILYKNFTTGDKAKNHNMVLLDSSGNLLAKSFPFDPKLSNMGWGSTGFLRKVNGEIFFSNAFSDTIFTFKDNYLSPKLTITIQSESIRLFQLDHKKLFFNKILLDSNTSFLGNTFLKNQNYIIFSYQDNKKIKTGIYNIKTNKLDIISAKVGDDSFISLILTPLNLGNDNTVIFSFSMKDLITVRTKHPDLLSTLSKNNKAILSDTTEKSGAFLLVSKIKNY